VATLLNNLFGRSKEPFWQQAYTDLLKFVILLRRIMDGYTTFSEVYRYILDDSQIDRDIRRLKAELTDPPDVLVIRSAEHRERCIQKPWTHWFSEDAEHMAHPYVADLETFLSSRKVVYEVRKPKGTGWAARKHQLEAVERWNVPAGVASTGASAHQSSRASSCFSRYSRQSRGPSRLLPAAQCVRRGATVRRAEADRAGRIAARERTRAGAELPVGLNPGLVLG
jgi:hypothetical protein